MVKRGQQLFEVALHVEEGIRLRGGVHALGDEIAGSGESQMPALVMAVAQLLEDFARFEQAHVRCSAIQVVADHVDEPGQQRRPHVGRFFVQRIRDRQRLGYGCCTLGGCPTQASFAWSLP